MRLSNLFKFFIAWISNIWMCFLVRFIPDIFLFLKGLNCLTHIFFYCFLKASLIPQLHTLRYIYRYGILNIILTCISYFPLTSWMEHHLDQTERKIISKSRSYWLDLFLFPESGVIGKMLGGRVPENANILPLWTIIFASSICVIFKIKLKTKIEIRTYISR